MSHGKPERPSASWVQQAQGIADVGDRWFVGLAKGVLRIGTWAKKEANVATDAATAAMATTVDVTRRLTGSSAGRSDEGRRPLSTRRAKREQETDDEVTFDAYRDHDPLPPPPRLDDLELEAAQYLPRTQPRSTPPPAETQPPPARGEQSSETPSRRRPSEQVRRPSRPSGGIEIHPAYSEPEGENEPRGEIGALSRSVLAAPAGDPAGVVPLLQALGDVVADYEDEGYAGLQEDERFWAVLGLIQLLTNEPPRSPDHELNHQER